MSNKANITIEEEAASVLVPKLRFPAFAEEEPWTSNALIGLCFLKKGDQLAASDKDASGRFPHYNGGIQPSSFTHQANREAETIIISEGGNSCGYVQFIRDPFWSGGHCYSLAVKPQVEKLCLFFALQAKQREIMALRIGSGLPNIQKTTLGQFRVALPPQKAEQQKIAECLSSLDELLAAQARKVEALKTHKKGLMQQLFPREGETQPRLRFPEFQNAGEWGIQSVGDFGQVVTGSTPSTNQPKFYDGEIPFVSPADISDLRFVDQTKTTLTEDGFAETRPIKAGSVLFVCIGSTIGKVAQNARDCATNQQINAVVPNSKHSAGFVYFALSFASERISLLAGRQAVPIINKSLFSSVRILSPKLPEQHRIADCLSSLDARITAETQKLEALKTHKKGLMQQLFPSLEKSQ